MLRRLRKRLYLQIYLAFVGVVIIMLVCVAVLFTLFEDEAHGRQIELARVVAEALLPPPQAPAEQLRAVLQRWHERLGAGFTVLAAGGEELASVGERVAQLEELNGRQGWVRFRRGRLLAGVRLADGRWLLMRHQRDDGGPWPVLLVVLAVAIGIGVLPVARRITRRLERLRSRVELLGAGALDTRVTVEGTDEVAQLAGSFNRAAERIQTLVEGQRATLAGASHELRTPLTRMRMALELLDDGERTPLTAQMRADIDELDELIEELLAASRLAVDTVPSAREPLDLLALAAEEAARTGAEVDGAPTPYTGEQRWLARAVRNLLENAAKYGGQAVAVRVTPRSDGGACIVVEDDGAGVPADLRELIFEPFYRPPGMREGHERGVGLGLALVRQIAARHGGTVRCESRDGGGSRFVIDLPAPG